MKLNIGCGNKRLPGYTGVDVEASRSGVDIVAKADAIPLADNSVGEILAIHLWEHFYLWECPKVLLEWRRILRPGGLLVLELPDLVKAAKNLLDQEAGVGTWPKPDQQSMWAIYGDPTTNDPFMTHQWGWSPRSLSEFLKRHGFTGVVQCPTQWHPAGREHRDMRLEAYKPGF